MKKLYFLFFTVFLLATNSKEVFAAGYYPDSVSVSDTARYCVGALTVNPLVASFTQTSCGTASVITVTYQWYYNTYNSNVIIGATAVGAAGTVSTTATGGTVSIPGITPTVATPGAYYYFCVLTWGASGCITAGTKKSGTNLILVGQPGLLTMNIYPNPICAGDSLHFSGSAVGADTFKWIGPGGSGFSIGPIFNNPPPFSVNISDSGIYKLVAKNGCGSDSVSMHLVVNERITFYNAWITPDTVCSGDTLYLHDTVVGGTGITYTWIGSNFLYTSTIFKAIDSVKSNTTLAGVYTFVATAAGCPSDTIVTQRVQVDTTPIIIWARVLDNPICTDYPISLTDSQRYGTSFLWIGPSASGYTSTMKNPTPFPATMSDTGKYIFIIRNSCGSDTATTSRLVVKHSPAKILGSDTALCVGFGTLQFVDTTVGGHWGSTDTFVAKVNTVGTVTGVGPGTTKIYYITALGCYDSVIVTIGVPPLRITGKDTICVGDTAQFHDATPGGIWTVENANATIGIYSGIAQGITAGIDYIYYTTPGCPPVKDTLTILERPGPITGIFLLCKGSTVTLTDNTPGGTWSCTNTSVSIVTSIGFPNALLTGINSGIDSVIYSLSTGCRVVEKVTIDTLPNVIIKGDSSICKGECAILKITNIPNSTYDWKPTTGISCTNCDSIKACPLTTQIYTVSVTDSAHCVGKAIFKLTVNPLPVIRYTPEPFFLCRGTPKQITVWDSLYTTDSFFWYPNVFISNDSIANPYFSDTTDLVYYVHATTPFGCKDSLKIPVSVLDSAFTTITPDTIICIGRSKVLTATSTDPKSTFKWSPAETLFPNDSESTVIATPSVTTTYKCVIIENACFYAIRYTTVYVDPMPQLVIFPVTPIIAGSSVLLKDSILNNDTGLVWEWTPPETVTCPSCPSTFVTPTVTTTYSLCVTSNRGCKSCDTVTVHIFCDGSQIFIPNTFSPNGDGYNDQFIVSGKGLGLITHISVFNRWGQMMYEAHNIPANDAAYGWNGNYQGQLLEPDVFMYVVEVMCETDNILFKFHGDITLIR